MTMRGRFDHQPLGAPLSGWGQITPYPPTMIQAPFREAARTSTSSCGAANAGSKEFVIPFDATTFAADPEYVHGGDGSARTSRLGTLDRISVRIPEAMWDASLWSGSRSKGSRDPSTTLFRLPLLGCGSLFVERSRHQALDRDVIVLNQAATYFLHRDDRGLS